MHCHWDKEETRKARASQVRVLNHDLKKVIKGYNEQGMEFFDEYGAPTITPTPASSPGNIYDPSQRLPSSIQLGQYLDLNDPVLQKDLKEAIKRSIDDQ
jgi:hypothetical protein